MKKALRWYEYFTINSFWLGINISTGIMTPLLLPFLVVLYMPPEEKSTHLATIRVIGLAVAMLVQPLMGMLSDRSTSKYGRRRPFIFWGAIFNILFLCIIGASTFFITNEIVMPLDNNKVFIAPPSSLPFAASWDGFFRSTFGMSAAFAILLIGATLLQVSANTAHGATQGLIPDLVPENQRGRASGVKAVLELLPSIGAIFIGSFVQAGQIWLTVGIIMAGFLTMMLVTIKFVKEEPLKEKPAGSVKEPVLRVLGLTVIFVAVTQLASWLVRASSGWMQGQDPALQIAVIGLLGLLMMAGAIIIGVYFGAWVGIGREAPRQKSFIWWVVNRLLFLAAVGSIQGFAQYYLRDVLKIPNAAQMTTVLLAVVAIFLVISAIGGGWLADRIGRRRLISLSGIVGAVGTVMLLLSPNMALVIVSGCVIGLATGTFMATNWALGTDLAPKADAGRYLGISNLAGAGAGIVGNGIGGPMADFFNTFQEGLGFIVIFSIFAGLFLLSTLTLRLVKTPDIVK